MSELDAVRDISAEEKRKKWKWIAFAVLGILALPTLIPLAIAAVGIAVAVVLTAAGGLLAAVLGIGGCILAGILGLAAVLACGLVGSGFGLVILFSAPASGLSILGLSMIAVGASVLGILLLWQLAKLCAKGVKAFWVWLRGAAEKKRKDRGVANEA